MMWGSEWGLFQNYHALTYLLTFVLGPWRARIDRDLHLGGGGLPVGEGNDRAGGPHA